MSFDPLAELPVHGPAWERAREAGTDTALLEAHLQMTPADRIRALGQANRLEWDIQSRTLPAELREELFVRRARAKAALLGG
ncbi:MAG: hypothetical protein HY904_16395 [Deltaproteobacteria bacterium]|nr:hypothetical protein [Deltaproteobacteria bacterium]